MKSPVQVHIPYPQLADHLEYLCRHRLNPELYFPGDALDALVAEELAAAASTLHASGLAITIHAPFMDLNPGSTERLIREATLRRFHQVLDAAELLKPRVMVFHPGYDRWRYGEAQEKWLGHSIETFRQVLVRAEQIGCIVAVENIFEEEPSTLRTLLEAVDSPRLRHCFDVGHWNLFKKVGLEKWFAELGSFIAEAHIHDNCGTRDDHAPPGGGDIDFALFFRLMQQYAPDAVWTIEAHSREKVEQALAALEPYRFGQG